MRSFLLYAEATLLSLVIIFTALDLWNADLRIPLYYSVGSDVHFFLALIKTVAETGWYFENPWLGAPGTLKIYDFPFVETGTFLGLKLFILLFRDPYLAGNLFYLATYVLASWTSLYVLRRFGVQDQVAVAASLLFTFTPYHFWRGPAHLHLSAYYPIPLIVMVSLWLSTGQPLFFRANEQGRVSPTWHRGRLLPVLVTTVLVSMAGPYHAYFGTFLLVIGGFIGFLRKPCLQRALDAVVCIGLVVGLFLLQVLPFVVGSHRQGYVRRAFVRTTQDYHNFVLQLVNLVRPTVGHRLPWLSQLSSLHRDVDLRELPWLLGRFGEAMLCPPLGILGSIGIFFLIAVALATPFPLTRRLPILGDLGKFCTVSLILCLSGGIGEIIATYITAMIRCYNRISIFLSFFACFAVALVAGGAATESGKGDWRRKPGFVFLVWGSTVLALLDQIPPGAIPDYKRDAAQFLGDRQFVHRIEQAVPSGRMVFQLPVVDFPEAGLKESMEDYSHFRCYIHSSQIRWSFGTMKGREVAKLQSELAKLTQAELVEHLKDMGFAGIFINRKGLPEGGRKEIQWLLRIVPQVPIQGQDSDLLFLRLPSQ